MISAESPLFRCEPLEGFSAIARSVMISAMLSIATFLRRSRFSAIARSVMISALKIDRTNRTKTKVSVL